MLIVIMMNYTDDWCVLRDSMVGRYAQSVFVLNIIILNSHANDAIIAFVLLLQTLRVGWEQLLTSAARSINETENQASAERKKEEEGGGGWEGLVIRLLNDNSPYVSSTLLIFQWINWVWSFTTASHLNECYPS